MTTVTKPFDTRGVEPVELRTERLQLRLVTAADQPALVEACNDPLIAQYIPVPSPYTDDDARRFVSTATRGWSADTQYGFGFYVGDSTELAGTCVLRRVEYGVMELGYWAAPAYRGKGFTVEAARHVCQWGFDELKIHRIEWWCVVGNQASRTIAESIGFEFEGLLRQRAYMRGRPRDWWVAGLLSRPA